MHHRLERRVRGGGVWGTAAAPPPRRTRDQLGVPEIDWISSVCTSEVTYVRFRQVVRLPRNDALGSKTAMTRAERTTGFRPRALGACRRRALDGGRVSAVQHTRDSAGLVFRHFTSSQLRRRHRAGQRAMIEDVNAAKVKSDDTPLAGQISSDRSDWDRIAAMNDAWERAGSAALVRDVARNVVVEMAPAELPLFPTVSDAWLADPEWALRQKRGGNAVLGFGAETLALLTPVAMYAVSEALKILAEAARKAVSDGLAREGTTLIGAMFKRYHDPDAAKVAAGLVEAQLVSVQARILSAGRELHLPDDRLNQLVSAVTTQLVRAK
jgi:hypothetical protein